MDRRIPLTAAGVGGGMLAAAFLSTAVAVAGPLSEDGATELVSSAVGNAPVAFAADSTSPTDIASLTFDDYTYSPVEANIDAAGIPSVLEWGQGTATFDVATADGTELGTFTSDVDVSSLFGFIDTTSFTFDSESFSGASGVEEILGDAPLSGLDDASGFAAGESTSISGLSDVADQLASNLDPSAVADGSVTGQGVTEALAAGDISIADDAGFTASDIADALNADDSAATLVANADNFDGVLSNASGVDLGNNVGTVADELASDLDPSTIANGDVTADEVTSALSDTSVTLDSGSGEAQSIADAINGADNLVSVDGVGDVLSNGDLVGATNADFDGGSLAEASQAIASSDIDLLGDGQITGSDVTDALDAENISIAGSADFDAGDLATALDSAYADGVELPADGATYQVTDLGFVTNVYSSVPTEDGTEISDTLITPFGNFDIMTGLDVGDAFSSDSLLGGLFGGDSGGGLFGGDSGGGLFGGLFDGLFGGLFGGDSGADAAGSAVIDDATTSEVETVLTNASTDFSDTGSQNLGVSDLADFIAGNDAIDSLGDDLSGQEISDALTNLDGFNIEDAGFSASDIADALNGANVVDEASADEITSVLTGDADISASGLEGGDISDLASVLAGSDSLDVTGGDLAGSDITDVLSGSDVSIADDAGFDASDIADALNGGDFADVVASSVADASSDSSAMAADEGGSLFGDLFGSLF